MTRIEVPLTDDQVVALRRLADQEHSTVAGVIQEGVDTLLRARRAASAAAASAAACAMDVERRKRAMAVSGRFRFGCSDLARRHDDYLAEAFDK